MNDFSSTTSYNDVSFKVYVSMSLDLHKEATDNNHVDNAESSFCICIHVIK